MSAEGLTVWVGLRGDGVELARVMAPCVEVSRSNGIAKFQCLGVVIFADLPSDVTEAVMTVSDSEHSHPFGALRLDDWRTFYAGSDLHLSDVTFERILEVPRYVKPEPKSKRKRLRLGN